ncbi:zinc dependent phospholipase C family protein [Tissierella carlieri]|uniref:Zinc dependent phospholipase C family protein n=1 Tax=Tissierella carlieri TaxID=689904 RepID=A0ABT1SFS7_9FIRM|nr:zinc dependent phospholipase C family protein [Tissierella carlieri]MCQ4925125.1 zinc dependent phospholipase C family protein [Tissierella carlieri]
MATWGAHIRIAETILNANRSLDEKYFLVGNVGPDCGEPNEDWSEFFPSKSVSHWINKDEVIEAEKFYDEYLNKEIEDDKLYSFLLGYYVHLLTDIEWGNMVDEKKKIDDEYKKLETDKKFIWTIKKDWYDLDHLYFRKNPNSIFHRIFKNIESFPDYLDYYPAGAIERQLRYISGFYTKYNGNPEREYIYLTEKEMDDFVSEKSNCIIELLKENRK